MPSNATQLSQNLPINAMAPAENTDLREWTYAQRKALLKGERVRIRSGAAILTETAKPILMAASTTANQIIKHNVILLPENVDKSSVLRLIRYIEVVAKLEVQPPRLAIDDVPKMLGIMATAQMLGMEKYTSHLYKKLEAQLRHDLLEYEDMDAVLAFKQQFPQLFKFLCDNMARRIL
jgi:hypothetical protein